MIIKSIILENFRGYSTRQQVELSKLTAFVGKNDAGKSSILEALDIFFNEKDAVVKLDKDDLNVMARKTCPEPEILIGVQFTDLPRNVILDDKFKTDLAAEYLLDKDNCLTILKRYPNAGTPKVFVYANHPQNPGCKESAHGIIYAIEEPETAQHVNHQEMMISALKALSQKDNVQVLLTTHSVNVLKDVMGDVLLISDSNGSKSIHKTENAVLPYPSHYETAYLAFGDISEGYHDELYGHIESNKWFGAFESGRHRVEYYNEGKQKIELLTKTKIIRNQIHHPENQQNGHYTKAELESSIIEMREFIMTKN